MKKKYPNTSILSLITQTDKRTETILSFYLKVIPDYIKDNSISWFDNKGRNGKASSVWEELSLKQWLAIGNDNEIHNLLNDILKNKVTKVNSKTINFIIPDFKKTPYSNLSIKNKSDYRFDSYIIDDFSLIPSLLLNKENLEILCGYKKTENNKIKPFYPFGLYEQDFIYNNFKKNIFGIVEYRQPYLTFRGVRKTSVKGKGSKEIIGFYQDKFSDVKEYSAKIINYENIELGKNQISKKNGTFKIGLEKPLLKGKILIKENNTDTILIDFTLIQDIVTDINVANKTFIDIYGRKFMITSKTNNSHKNLNPFTWEKNIYSKTLDANKKLSDLFKSNLEYLGESILIADPYFIGQIKQDTTTKEFILSDCQKSFINAITHCSIENNIEEIIILGYNSRANAYFDKSIENSKTKKEQRFEFYEKYLKSFINRNNFQKFFPNIIFKNSIKDFHSRYWFSLSKDDGFIKLNKCVIVTNSLGNMKEVDIIPITDKDQIYNITSRFVRILNNAQTELEIK